MNSYCKNLHTLFNKLTTFRFPFDDGEIPFNGIYILFEEGERAHGGNRIVRVGTHTGKDQLRSRLRQHFLMENKDRSIFRKNIGRAILNKSKDKFLEKWNLDLTTREAKERYAKMIDSHKLKGVEKSVSEYMRRSFFFSVFRVNSKDKRLEIESKIISTISACEACRPSPKWLGNYSPLEKIKKGGLWLVNELYKEPVSASDFKDIKILLGSKHLAR